MAPAVLLTVRSAEARLVHMLLPAGLLLVIEGIDGAGKTTQAERIARRLEVADLEVVRTKEPTNGPWGRKLRESAQTGRLSLDEELETFIKDRKEHVATLIKPSLAAGKVVIVDRYYFSTAAYQGARGADPERIIEENEAFAPKPDLLVLLDVDPSVGVSRIRGRGDTENLFEKEGDLRRCAEIFASLKRPELLRIDGRQSESQVTDLIMEALFLGPIRRVCCERSGPPVECSDVTHCIWAQTGKCMYPKLGQLAPTPIHQRLLGS